ncbi:GlpG protein (membrane protein of glp regulon) [Pseudoalteromonas luteoviolacea B = ATCC 29581]|nr:GlpG protein (membrane protein of glp regulon) [Pseudoalteromonas luteoviolacea B = ATCC 29581]
MHRALIRLGQHNHPRELQGLVDALQLAKIQVEVRIRDSTHAEIWISEKDQVTASVIWSRFCKNPQADEFQQAAWHLERPKPLVKYSGSNLNLLSRAIKLNPLVQLITIICLVTFISLHYLEPQATFNFFKFSVVSWPTWFSPMFLHFDALHLVFNLMWWIYLGDKIAKRLGTFTLMTLCVLSGLISNWMQYLLVDGNFGGLSGVVYALCGFAWLRHIKCPNEETMLSTAVIGMLLIWMIIGFADVLFINMANWAHFFGLLSGALIGWLWPRMTRPSDTGTS